MATVSSLQPKILSQSGEIKEFGQREAHHSGGKVCQFQSKEVDMMPGDWAETGNPSPYELRVTLHTCKRLWQLNQDALSHPDCDREVTLENIKVLEKLYIILMDYLVE
ncbi:hypothetical protein QCB45_02885 [Thiomicrorhabdus sp. ZW0627]|uniref:hypothetical protein n=1 Tax=Thiomicrorhabdus sp. ZW0627 TaxID=3039774 RepID=UPI002436D956|nr:hypothetical protein [Thiomicrorhabdus sp. ZW0627]MDG6773264.1 hypothetical protein [Thiomicrorhabdus sp. ZW0627]